MKNDDFTLNVGACSLSVNVDLHPLSNDDYLGPQLSINSHVYGHKMNGIDVLTDTDSIRELGHYLIEMADKYDDMPDGTYREYVEAMKMLKPKDNVCYDSDEDSTEDSDNA